MVLTPSQPSGVPSPRSSGRTSIGASSGWVASTSPTMRWNPEATAAASAEGTAAKR